MTRVSLQYGRKRGESQREKDSLTRQLLFSAHRFRPLSWSRGGRLPGAAYFTSMRQIFLSVNDQTSRNHFFSPSLYQAF